MSGHGDDWDTGPPDPVPPADWGAAGAPPLRPEARPSGEQLAVADIVVVYVRLVV